MKNIYQTQDDGHDFFPARDLCDSKPPRALVLEFCKNNLGIALENRIEQAREDGDRQAVITLSRQMKLWTTEDEYRARQSELAADYILDNYDWEWLFSDES